MINFIKMNIFVHYEFIGHSPSGKALHFDCEIHQFESDMPSSCESLADKFSNKLVNQIFNNQLPKALKTTFHVEKADEVPSNVKQITIEEVHNNTEKVMLTENIQG